MIHFPAKALLCFLLLLVCRYPVASELPLLQADMERLLQEEGLTGATWALISPDGDSSGAAGLANADSGALMTADNRVHVGSVTKTVLAMGVLRLITEGQLSLDTPVSALLPGLDIDNPWAATDPVRVAHLLAHTAGLDNLRFWQAFSLKPTADTPLTAAFAGDPSLLRVRTRPGSVYSYSNMGYGLLGIVIESVTRERYEHYLDTSLLRALGMRDSSFEFVSQTGTQNDERLAMGHFENGRTQSAVATYLRPAGQFTTTVSDMILFARFLMGDGSINGEVFIAPELLGALDRPQGTDATLAGLHMGHGLALARRDRHGVVGMCHPGTAVGFRAMLCLYPQQGKAFFVAVNTDSETADYNRLDALLLTALNVAGSPQKTSSVDAAENMSAWQGIYILSPNNMERFAWIDEVFNFLWVSWDGKHITLKPFASAARELTPAGGLLFRATDRTITSHVFFESGEGGHVISDGLHNYEKTPLLKMLLQWLSLIAGLLGIVWIFLMGMVRIITGRFHRPVLFLLPFISVSALFIPFPFFYLQSFLQIGDLTVASALLALVTGLLPLAMGVGIAVYFRQGAKGTLAFLDVIACFAVLQWAVLLMAVNLLPFRLWI
jgi:CubicO group peptidase (beta-lactamase class C family)